MKKIICLMFIFLATFIIVSKSSAGNVVDDEIGSYTDSDYMYGKYSSYTIYDYLESYLSAKEYMHHTANDNDQYLKLNSFIDNSSTISKNKLWCSNLQYYGRSIYDDYVYEVIADDPIVNIIPKKYFMFENTTAYLGNEYGFYIQTSKTDYVNNGKFYQGEHYGESHSMYVSKVFLYDIDKKIESKTNIHLKFIPLVSFEFVCIKANSYYSDSTSYEFFSKNNNVVMPSCFRIPFNLIGNLNYSFRNVLFTSELIGNTEKNDNDLYQNDENVPFIAKIECKKSGIVTNDIKNVNDDKVKFSDYLDIIKICYKCYSCLIDSNSYLIQTVKNSGELLYDEYNDEKKFNKLDYKEQYAPSEIITTFSLELVNSYKYQLEYYKTPIRANVSRDFYSEDYYLSCNGIKCDGESYGYIDYCVLIGNIDNENGTNLRNSILYDLYDEYGNKLDFTSLNCTIESNLYEKEFIDTSMEECLTTPNTNDLIFSFYIKNSGTYNIELSNNLVVKALYTENECLTQRKKTQIKYVGYNNGNKLSMYCYGKTIYKMKLKGDSKIGNIKISLDQEYPYTISTKLTGKQEYVVQPKENGLYRFGTDGNLDTIISVFEKKYNGYDLIGYADDYEYDDGDVDYNASLSISLEKGKEYKIVIEIYGEDNITDYQYNAQFYIASNSILDSVKFYVNQNDCHSFYYCSKSDSSMYIYTTGDVDTKLELYLGETLIDENDDTEISDDDIDYNAHLLISADRNATYKIVVKSYNEGVVTLCVNQ